MRLYQFPLRGWQIFIIFLDSQLHTRARIEEQQHQAIYQDQADQHRRGRLRCEVRHYPQGRRGGQHRHTD